MRQIDIHSTLDINEGQCNMTLKSLIEIGFITKFIGDYNIVFYRLTSEKRPSNETTKSNYGAADCRRERKTPTGSKKRKDQRERPYQKAGVEQSNIEIHSGAVAPSFYVIYWLLLSYLY
jgi:DNA-dependent RNA polymerase auxiliary subunit epsilon